MLRARLSAPSLRGRPEETLRGRHAINNRRILQRGDALLGKRNLIGPQRNRQPRKVADILTQSQLTIHPELLRVKVRRGVGVILLHQCARALGKLGEILLGPPVIQRTVAVIKRTFIVKPVADLVTDHHADAAVVRCVVGLRIEEGRAQNSRREHNLVSGRHIVGVHSLRRHQPLVLIHRIARAIDHEIAVKSGGAAQVLEQVTGHQGQL